MQPVVLLFYGFFNSSIIRELFDCCFREGQGSLNLFNGCNLNTILKHLSRNSKSTVETDELNQVQEKQMIML